MGNSQPTNRTGRQATAQKLENAKKVGMLSLTEHKLHTIPSSIYELGSKLKTLDLSKNSISYLDPRIVQLTHLKTLLLEHNKLCATTLQPIVLLHQLQKLNVSYNDLGHYPTTKTTTTPTNKKKTSSSSSSSSVLLSTTQQASREDILPMNLPISIRELSIQSNQLTNVPTSLFALERLEKLNLSHNQLQGCLDESIGKLIHLIELILDRNALTALPVSIGSLTKLKVLSLKHNQFRGGPYTTTTTEQQQSLPSVLFSHTPVIDLNLHGNPMTNTELNEMIGFDLFLQRRQQIKSKTMYNLSICGLD